MITAYDQDVLLTYAQQLSDSPDGDEEELELGDEEESGMEEDEEEDGDEDMEAAG